MPGAAGRIPSLANLSQQSRSLVMVSCLFSQGRKLRQREAEEMAEVRGTVEGTSLVVQGLRPCTHAARVLGQGLLGQGTGAHMLHLKKTWRRQINIKEKGKRRGQWASIKPGCCEATACSLH